MSIIFLYTLIYTKLEQKQEGLSICIILIKPEKLGLIRMGLLNNL